MRRKGIQTVVATVSSMPPPARLWGPRASRQETLRIAHSDHPLGTPRGAQSPRGGCYQEGLLENGSLEAGAHEEHRANSGGKGEEESEEAWVGSADPGRGPKGWQVVGMAGSMSSTPQTVGTKEQMPGREGNQRD